MPSTYTASALAMSGSSNVTNVNNNFFMFIIVLRVNYTCDKNANRKGDNIMIRFEPHSHSDFSNLRLIDCINTPKKLIDKALELGLAGIALTDHETVAGHMDANIYAKEIEEKNPDFKVALGNEIYLCETREKKQQNYHFILIAKNKMGQRALRELSSRAWMNSFKEGPMERVITLYSDLEEIVNKYPNSLIATSACLGGQVSAQALKLIEAEQIGDKAGAERAHNDIVKFVLFCKELFLFGKVVI